MRRRLFCNAVLQRDRVDVVVERLGGGRAFVLERRDLLLQVAQPGAGLDACRAATVVDDIHRDTALRRLLDPYLDRRTAETVAAKTGATVVDVAQFPGGVKGTDGGYIALMDYLVNSVASALAK